VNLPDSAERELAIGAWGSLFTVTTEAHVSVAFELTSRSNAWPLARRFGLGVVALRNFAQWMHQQPLLVALGLSRAGTQGLIACYDYDESNGHACVGVLGANMREQRVRNSPVENMLDDFLLLVFALYGFRKVYIEDSGEYGPLTMSGSALKVEAELESYAFVDGSLRDIALLAAYNKPLSDQ
jgi:hypothetical protein